ncbi:MarR family winged helix-turn-helix transcriptional regulator [Brevibacterium litoralis]|uniref:MarR family winged helix-turn-helix transcriptional regulator n=1 Tax=Brevibacterium litoralis TaxID=3138935 RepID=UPI0032EF4325
MEPSSGQSLPSTWQSLPIGGPGLPGQSGLLGETAVLDAWRAYFETGQRLVDRIEDELKAETGMTLSDFNLLLVLVEAPDRRLRMNELARRIVFSAPRLTYRVQVLGKKGWVEKQDCPEDKRAHYVALTPHGMEEYLRAGAVQRRLIGRYFESALGPGDAAEVQRISRAIADRLD